MGDRHSNAEGDNWEDMRNIVANRKERSNQEYNESSRDRLGNIVSKKMTTIMIGALSEFENAFGYLWGRDSNKPLSLEQKRLKARWYDVRNNILNRGNSQIRGFQEEIVHYKVTWNRYQVRFKKGDDGRLTTKEE